MKKTLNSIRTERIKREIDVHLQLALESAEEIGDFMLSYFLKMAIEEIRSKQ